MTNSKNREELSFIYIVIFACMVTLLTIILAFCLGNLKPINRVSVATLIESDYQMESAVLMQMQSFKQSRVSNKQDSLKKEIMPNIFMTVDCNQIKEDEFVFNTSITVNGQNFYRRLKIKSRKSNPESLEFLE